MVQHICMQNEHFETFSVSKSLKQGCILASILFSIYLVAMLIEILCDSIGVDICDIWLLVSVLQYCLFALFLFILVTLDINIFGPSIILCIVWFPLSSWKIPTMYSSQLWNIYLYISVLFFDFMHPVWTNLLASCFTFMPICLIKSADMH